MEPETQVGKIMMRLSSRISFSQFGIVDSDIVSVGEDIFFSIPEHSKILGVWQAPPVKVSFLRSIFYEYVFHPKI